jgi:hypothetical protein
LSIGLRQIFADLRIGKSQAEWRRFDSVSRPRYNRWKYFSVDARQITRIVVARRTG